MYPDRSSPAIVHRRATERRAQATRLRMGRCPRPFATVRASVRSIRARRKRWTARSTARSAWRLMHPDRSSPAIVAPTLEPRPKEAVDRDIHRTLARGGSCTRISHRPQSCTAVPPNGERKRPAFGWVSARGRSLQSGAPVRSIRARRKRWTARSTARSAWRLMHPDRSTVVAPTLDPRPKEAVDREIMQASSHRTASASDPPWDRSAPAAVRYGQGSGSFEPRPKDAVRRDIHRTLARGGSCAPANQTHALVRTFHRGSRISGCDG
jgi:hypothetical protein